MIEGLWIVQFHGPQGSGGGIVVLTRGQALGGDSGFTYSGTYQFRENILNAKISVKNFDPSIPNVLGIPGDFELLVEGKIEGDGIVGTAALAKAPDAKMLVRLRKASDLK